MIYTLEMKIVGLHQVRQLVINNQLISCYIIVGEVLMKKYATVWHNAVVRGDINRVE